MATPSDELAKILERRRSRADKDNAAGPPDVPPPSTPEPSDDDPDMTDDTATADADAAPVSSLPADVSPAVDFGPIPTPSVPTCDSTRGTSITVSWTIPDPSQLHQLVFKVEYGTTGLWSAFSSWVVAAPQLVSATQYTVDGLTPYTSYTFRVSAAWPANAPSPYKWGTPSAASAAFTTLTEEEEKVLKDKEDSEVAEAKEKIRKSQEEYMARKASEEADRRRVAELSAASRGKEADRLAAALADLERQRAEMAEQAKDIDARRRAAEDAAKRLEVQTEKLAAERAAAEARAAKQAEQTATLEAQLKELQRLRQEQLEAEKERVASLDAQARKAAEEAEERRRAAEAAAALHADEVATLKAQMATEARSSAARTAEASASIELLQRQLDAAEAERVRAMEQAEAIAASESEAAQATRRERDEVVARMQAVEDELRIAKVRAQLGDAAASDATDTILKQEEEFEQLLAYLRYKDALLKSLQGAGPNPTLEAQLVSDGYSRENVRFFMEVQGENKAKLVSMLDRQKDLVEKGYDEDGVREALTVVKEKDDMEALTSYLTAFSTAFASHKRWEALLAGSDGKGLSELLLSRATRGSGAASGSGAGAGAGSGAV